MHDEVAAHIQNSLEEVQYIDGVSSGDESEPEEDKDDKDKEDKEKSDSSEEIVDTFRVIGLRRKKGESLVSINLNWDFMLFRMKRRNEKKPVKRRTRHPGIRV